MAKQRRLSDEQKRQRRIMRKLEDRLVDLNKQADRLYDDLVFFDQPTEDDKRYRPVTVNAGIEAKIKEIENYLDNLYDHFENQIELDSLSNYDFMDVRRYQPYLEDALNYQDDVPVPSKVIRVRDRDGYSYRVVITYERREGYVRPVKKDTRKRGKRKDVRKNSKYRKTA